MIESSAGVAAEITSWHPESFGEGFLIAVEDGQLVLHADPWRDGMLFLDADAEAQLLAILEARRAG